MSEPPLRDHLSRQMKVTKAKALFICHSCVATRVRLINALPKCGAAHLLRSEIAAPTRSEVLLVFVSPF